MSTNPQRTIKCYASNGDRLRNRSLESIETLLQLGKISVSRNRRGTIVGAQFLCEANGANPVKKNWHMGQAYSIHENLFSGARAWKHKELLQSQEVEAVFGETVESQRELDLYLRSIFRAVPLSCLVSEKTAPAPKQPAKVLNIADYAYRRQRRQSDKFVRPIEFDSERRVA